ncbi:hypothetical protein TNCV_3173311 [Trichonephila clavipes]|nr:hypothetical protein TNCV_3173311 [Trichonephila clavipes]
MGFPEKSQGSVSRKRPQFQIKWADIENYVEFLSKEMPDFKMDDSGLFEEERRLNAYLNSTKLVQLENQHAEIDKRWCKDGARVVGCCARVVYVLSYLGYWRHNHTRTKTPILGYADTHQDAATGWSRHDSNSECEKEI